MYVCSLEPGPPALLSFTTLPPSSLIAGANFSMQVNVSDAQGHLCTNLDADSPLNVSLQLDQGGTLLRSASKLFGYGGCCFCFALFSICGSFSGCSVCSCLLS